MENLEHGRVCRVSNAPIIIIPEIAFVTLINGECSAGVTCQIEKYPTKHAKIKIFIRYILYSFNMVEVLKS